MRQETNNEIDLLLRRMGRRDGAASSNGEAAEQQLREHLDADELSSYAQNALPAAARARYTEHLADCSTCRKLVTELSLSLGATAAAAAPVAPVSAPGALKQFLASLFSPMVLRYAVPALGLIVVAVIGFVALRRQNQPDSLARINADQKERIPITATPQPTPGESPLAGYIDPNKQSAGASPIEQPKETAPARGVVAGEPAGTGAGPVVAAPAPVVRDQAAPEAQPKVEADPPPPSPAKAAEPAAAEEPKKDEGKTRKQLGAVETKEAEISAARSEAAGGRDLRRAPQTAAKRADDNKAKDAPAQGRTGSVSNARVFSTDTGQADKNEAAEARTVSGRRFRKERGIWTDTAYDSSTATVNVARGSDQFRALVADEPEIKKIAEQLDGEVIVVWKGRAYRIR